MGVAIRQLEDHPISACRAAPAHGRVPELDGLRGLAIALVFVAHVLQPPPASVGPVLRTIYRVAHNGVLGVDLFFVLSGFLITGILLEAKGGVGYFYRFYARRAVRILPLYYGIVLALVLWPRSGVAPLQAWYWLHATNWWMGFHPAVDLPNATSHFWSLAIEEQFYLVWPLVVWWLTPRQVLRVAAYLCGIAFLVRVGLVWQGFPYRTLRTVTVTAWDPLAVGAMLAVVARDPASWRRLASPAASIMVLAVLILLTLEVLYPFGTPQHRFAMPLQTTATAAGFGALLVHTMSGRFGRMIILVPIRWLGRVSYGVYVFHFFVVATVLDVWPRVPATPWAFLLHQLALFLAIGGLTCGLAALSWRYYERPLLALRRFVPMPTGVSSSAELGAPRTPTRAARS